MTTSQMDASAWSQTAQIGTSETLPAKQGPNWAVALIGVGAVLNVGWVALVAFVAVKLIIL
ncbi:hypothetical protein [Bosea vaviloviae]|jgi:hypothetical protein|uniref:hypothetical protein n=1 Tax=Bosea vaviloviae TaxID=1526658 RepID=UPI000A924884|nr:hypothetical protein [Bosea vaviloviae]